MKLQYYRDTDSLYIDLSSKPSAESREVSDGIVLDYDADGNLVGIDIDNASRKIDLKEIILSKLPTEVEALTAWTWSDLSMSHDNGKARQTARLSIAGHGTECRGYTRCRLAMWSRGYSITSIWWPSTFGTVSVTTPAFQSNGIGSRPGAR